MVSRSVLVRLQADVAGFVRALNTAEDSVNRVGTAGVAIGAALTAAVGVSIEAWARFDKAMSGVQAATHETSRNMDLLADAAMDAGASTVYSATEAAGAIEELSKAGVSTSDILNGGLSGALSLASAGSLEVGEAAEIAATALTQFRLAGSDVEHIADLLAAGAGKAQGDVGDLGAALKQSGLVASQFGLSVEDTVGTLSAFAKAGLIGSDSGTSFKTMLLSLANPAKETKARMDELGLSAYDAQGNFVGITDLADQLQTKLGGLTQAQRDQTLAMIFGTDAIRGANVLYQQGASGIQAMIDATNDAGYAQETAALKLDNLKGDIEALGGAWETAAIKTGSNGDTLARTAVQGATAVVNAYGDLGKSQQAVLLGGTALAAGITLVGGTALLAVPKIIAMRAAMQTLATAAPRTAAALGVAGTAAIGLATAFAALTAADLTNGALADTTVASANETTAALLGMGTSLEKVNAIIAGTSQKNDRFTQWNDLADAAKQLTDPALIDRVNDFAGELTSLGSNEGSEGRTALIEQLGVIGDSLGAQVSSGNADAAREQFAALAAEWERGGGTVEQLKELMPGYTDALSGVENGQAQAAMTGDELASTITGVAAQTEDAASATDTFSDALDSLLAQFFDVDSAADAFQTSLLKLADAAKENGRSVEGNTKESIANREAMRSSADAAADLLKAMASQGATSDEIAAKAAELKGQFLDQARAAGFTGEQVDKVAAAYDAMPSLVQTALVATGLDTMSNALDGVIRKVNTLNGKTFTTYFDVKGTGAVASGRAGVQVARADGGLIPLGLGGPRQDNVLAAVSSGEFVVNAAATADNRGLLEAINSGAIKAYADGGLIGAGSARGGSAGLAVSSSYLSGALAATTGPVSEERYAAALAASARAADTATLAEARLEQLRARGEQRLETLSATYERQEEATKAAGDARIDAMDAEVDALKRRQDEAAVAFKRRQDDELDALRARSKDEGAIKALQRRQEDAERAFDNAQTAEVEAAQARITAAKDANRKATEALSKANEEALDRAKASQTLREADAEEALTAAKDAAKDASQELTEAENELSEARARALALAEQVSDALTKNATLTGLFGNTDAADLRETTTALQEASAAAADAGRNARGEDATGALTRRTAALNTLADSARKYAAAQEAMGVDASAIGAGLDQVAAQIRDLGAAYGLTSDQVEKLTGSLQVQRTSGADLLASMQRELAKTAELSSSVQTLLGAGLNSTLLDQVISGGTGTGLQLARAILGGGGDLIGQLNATQAALTATANGLGVAVASARYSPTGSASSTSTLDAASVALLERAITAAASRVPVLTLDGAKISANVSQRSADIVYGAEAP